MCTSIDVVFGISNWVLLLFTFDISKLMLGLLVWLCTSIDVVFGISNWVLLLFTFDISKLMLGLLVWLSCCNFRYMIFVFRKRFSNNNFTRLWKLPSLMSVTVYNLSKVFHFWSCMPLIDWIL